jgi:hypothetical protein
MQLHHNAERWAALSAANDVERSIELSGGRDQLASVEALFLLGLIHDRLGQWAAAAEAFGDAIDALQKGAQTSDDKGEVEDEDDEAEPTQAKQSGSGGKASPLSGRHKYGIQTFKKPTFCDHCGKLLIGFRSQGLPSTPISLSCCGAVSRTRLTPDERDVNVSTGYQCAECNSTIHANCRQSYQQPCRTAPGNTQ